MSWLVEPGEPTGVASPLGAAAGEVDRGETIVAGAELLWDPVDGAAPGVADADVVREPEGTGVGDGAASGATPRIVTTCSL